MSNLHKGTIKGWPWTRGPKVYKRNFALFSFFTFFQKGGIIHEIGTYFQKEDTQKIQHFMNEGSDFVKRKSVKEMYKIELIQMSEIETSFPPYSDNVKSYFLEMVPIFFHILLYFIPFSYWYVNKLVHRLIM